jgi:hypothetical protein
MADTIYYVNTASTAGGDGTTNATTGANRAYPSLYSIETAIDGTINVGDRVIIYCDGGLDSTAVTIGGWTINGQLIITAHPNSKHNGILDLNKYYYSATITVNESNVVFDGLQFYQATNATTSIYLASASINPTVKNCLFRGRGNGSGYAVRSVFSKAGTTLIYNNIVYNCEGAFSLANSSVNSIDIVANNTISNPENQALNFGISLSSNSTYYIYNNLIKGTYTSGAYLDQSTGVDPITDNNITSDASSPDGLGSKTITFVDEANADFHLSPSDTSGALNGGNNLASYFTTDIDDQTRSIWTIGADEVLPSVEYFDVPNKLYFLFNIKGKESTSKGIQGLGTKDSNIRYDAINLVDGSRHQDYKTHLSSLPVRVGYTWDNDYNATHFIITKANRLESINSNTVDIDVYGASWATASGNVLGTNDLVGTDNQDLIIRLGVQEITGAAVKVTPSSQSYALLNQFVVASGLYIGDPAFDLSFDDLLIDESTHTDTNYVKRLSRWYKVSQRVNLVFNFVTIDKLNELVESINKVETFFLYDETGCTIPEKLLHVVLGDISTTQQNATGFQVNLTLLKLEYTN